MTQKNVYIIAEVGNLHDGSLSLAKELVKSASRTGVDAVKFQMHIFSAESLDDAPNPPYFKKETRKQYFERTSFTLEEWLEIKSYCETECNVDFLCSPFSLESVDLLEELSVKAYKIPSGEVTNLPLLKKIGKTGKPVFLSSGMSFWSELDDAVKELTNNGTIDLTVLQCTSDYPCLAENAGLNILDELKVRYSDHKIGYSDHTLGSEIAIAAVCKGAVLVEKHFTLSKSMYGSDAAFSTEPDEFSSFVQSLRRIETAFSHQLSKDNKADTLREMKHTFEKMIVAGKDLKRGTTIRESDLAFKKPMRGVSASVYKDMIGKVLKVDLKKNDPIIFEGVE